MIPHWLHVLSLASLSLGVLSAAALAIDLWRRPQPMWIMNIVWPTTALFGLALAVWAYGSFGRAGRANNRPVPFAAQVAKSTTHCGSGCTIGDLCAEWLAFAVPAVPVAFGWQTLFSEKMFAVWILDYLFAFVFGIAFQYFTIAPMKNLGLVQGLREAIKVDFLSLTAWQVGMYGFMAIAAFVIFRNWLGVRLQVDSTEFWFMMQIAMLFGFATSYPVNWWLVRAGIKEAM